MINYEDQKALLKDRRQIAQSFKMRKEHKHYKRTRALQNTVVLTIQTKENSRTNNKADAFQTDKDGLSLKISMDSGGTSLV